jgi:site-specific recombinase XerD
MQKKRQTRSNTIIPEDWITPPVIVTWCQWVEERGGNPVSTVSDYEGILNRLAVWLRVNHDLDVEGATEPVLREWRTSLTTRGLARASIHHYVATVQGFYLWATRCGLVLKDPSWQVPKPGRRRMVPRPIHEQSLVLAVETASHRIRPWLVLAAWAGLRAIEIAQLERQDIYEGEDRPYMIVRGKGDKERHVPLAPYVWEALLLHGMPSRGRVFRRVDGAPVTPGIVSQQCGIHLKGLGIANTLHSFRHRFGTIAVEHGDIRELQEVMGHASLNQTSGYVRANTERAHRMVHAIPAGPSARV